MKKYKLSSNIRRLRKEELTILWKFSVPSLLASVMVGPVLWWTKTYLISRSSYSEMAVYDVAEQWYTIVLFVPVTLAQIILPMLTNTLEEGSKEQYLKLVKINLGINVLVSLVLSLFIILIGPYIMEFYGKGFVDIRTMSIMMMATVASSACNVVGQVIASRDKMWYGFAFNMLWAVIFILLTVFCVGSLGMEASGLALAFLLSYILHFILQTIYLSRVLNK